jgi:uncharacterized membrane-anchored protein
LAGREFEASAFGDLVAENFGLGFLEVMVLL